LVESELSDSEKELFIRYGSAASEAMLDFPCHFFRVPGCQGILAYRVAFNCAIVFGEPICPPDETIKLAEAFYNYCRASHLNIIYIIVSEKFAKWAKDSHCHILIEVCEEFIFDPESDPCASSSRLRHRVEKGAKHGLTVHEYIPINKEIEHSLQQVGIKWNEAIKGPHIYLGHLNFFENYVGKRWFYVKDGEQMTAMIMLSKIENEEGWLLKFLIIMPDAFHDTSEFLMASVLKILREENCHFLTKGMMPANRLGEVSGLSNFSTWILRHIYQTLSWIFKFKKRKEYWLRYHPKSVPSYLLLSNPNIGFNEMKALLKVFRTNIQFISKQH
jgi:lysylphosphatidylglycerol synthetase-like protein (DUF2156 family)